MTEPPAKARLGLIGIILMLSASLVLTSLALVDLRRDAAEQEKELRKELESKELEIDELRTQLTGRSPASAADTSRAIDVVPARPVIESEGFSVSLETCDRSGSATYCKFSIENHFGERVFGISARPDDDSTTRAVDEFGNVYPAQEAGIGTEEGHLPFASISSGTPITAWVAFRDVSPDAKTFARLDLFSGSSGRFEYFRFSGAPLV